MSEKKLARLLVKGMVQGVGFRASVRTLAATLPLLGTVRNLANGAVEIFIEGKEADIEIFLNKIKTETLARVEDVEVQFYPSRGEFLDFRIIR